MSRAAVRQYPVVPSRLVVFFLVGTAICAFMLTLELSKSEIPPPDSGAAGYTYPYSPPHNAFEVAINKSDGQAYALLAQDPSLSHPEVFIDGKRTMAYFGEKPLLIYLLWASSLGQPSFIPWAFGALSALFVGCYAASCGLLTQTHYGGRADRLSLVCLLLPGAFGSYFYGPGLLALALGLAGVVLWDRSPRWRVVAALCFVVGALARETTLFFPFVIGVLALRRRTLTWRDAGLLLAGPLALVLSVLTIRWRLGPQDRGLVTVNIGLPLKGFLNSIEVMGPMEWLTVAAFLGCFAVAIIQVRRGDDLMWHAFVWMAFGVCLSQRGWSNWQPVARLALPAFLLPVLSLVGRYYGEDAINAREVTAAAGGIDT